MKFLSALIFFVCALCLGGTVGVLFSFFKDFVIKKKSFKSYFFVLCVLLSIAVAFAAAGFVLIEDTRAQLLYVKQNQTFFILVASCGFLCTAFWKIALPVFVLLYIVLASFTGSNLYKSFGTMPTFVPVTVNQSSVNCDGSDFFIDSPQKKSLVIEVYTLPSILILPLPRLWYYVIGVTDSSYVDDGSDIRLKSGFSGRSETVDERALYLSDKKILEPYAHWLFSDRKYIFVPIPDEENLPSVFRLNFKERDEKLFCSLSKSL